MRVLLLLFMLLGCRTLSSSSPQSDLADRDVTMRTRISEQALNYFAPDQLKFLKPMQYLIDSINHRMSADVNATFHIDTISRDDNWALLKIRTDFYIEAEGRSQTTRRIGRDVVGGSTALIKATATKNLWISDEWITTQPTKVEVTERDLQYTGASSRRFLWRLKRRAARREFDRSGERVARQAEAEAVEEISQTIDEAVDPYVQTASKLYDDLIVAPFIKKGLLPGNLIFRTTDDEFKVELVSDGGTRYMDGYDPMSDLSAHDFSSQVNESVLNAFYDQNLGGKTLKMIEFKEILSSAPLDLLSFADESEFLDDRLSISFSEEAPMRVEFQNNLVRFIMRASYEGLPLGATALNELEIVYSIERDEQGLLVLKRTKLDTQYVEEENKRIEEDSAIERGLRASRLLVLEGVFKSFVQSQTLYPTEISKPKLELDDAQRVANVSTVPSGVILAKVFSTEGGWLNIAYDFSEDLGELDADQRSGRCLLTNAKGWEYCRNDRTREACQSWAAKPGNEGFQMKFRPGQERCIQEYPLLNLPGDYVGRCTLINSNNTRYCYEGYEYDRCVRRLTNSNERYPDEFRMVFDPFSRNCP